MKNFCAGLLCLLTVNMILPAQQARAQTPAARTPQTQTPQTPVQQVPTPAQQAQMQQAQARALAQAQANAKKLTITQMKAELEKSPNPPLYAKQILQKKFKIDTIAVTRTKSFNSLADSLAYNGKEKKVYGPFGDAGKQFLVQILTKAPNLFYHISQIFIDTSVFRYRIADSLGDMILDKLHNGTAGFGQLAQTYSMGGESATQGDLGWIARGVLLPQIEHEVALRKKGDTFKIWSPRGLHIIRKDDDAKQDTGFALMMRVFL